MLSVIVCSISPEAAAALQENIARTIGNGIGYEFIIWDNRKENRPIAQVYNNCAKQAAGNKLKNVHEDVVFLSENWGKAIEKKLQEPDCGVIGFAGSIIKPAVYSGWSINRDCERSHYWFMSKGERKLCHHNITKDSPFQQVVTLDGLGFFVRKEVHERHPFDEKMLTGFHCYDLDYTLEISKYYKNYCCVIDILHMSNGSYNATWVAETKKMHRLKWNEFLPLTIDGVVFTPKQMQRINDDALWKFFRASYRTLSPSLAFKNLLIYSKLPVSIIHIRRICSGIVKIIRLTLYCKYKSTKFAK